MAGSWNYHKRIYGGSLEVHWRFIGGSLEVFERLMIVSSVAHWIFNRGFLEVPGRNMGWSSEIFGMFIGYSMNRRGNTAVNQKPCKLHM